MQMQRQVETQMKAKVWVAMEMKLRVKGRCRH
jgi:hypothetical protein